ncbi:hypothetical protein ACJEBK_05100 [Peribacillus frigoritolerans]|uniref:hypothetical protein n=1 Tax=Peribacillus frigoritolerans TaxID=450367 RepID=UPI003870F3A2
MSKFVLNGLTQLIAVEIKVDIKINVVDPGWVSSIWVDHRLHELLSKLLSQ